MILSELIKSLQEIEKEFGAEMLVAVDTEARCDQAHLYKVTGASHDPELAEAYGGEPLAIIYLEI